MTRYRVVYKYITPSPAGPYKGHGVISSTLKPSKGDHVNAPFGRAIITLVTKENSNA